jgi:hypothetical protein
VRGRRATATDIVGGVVTGRGLLSLLLAGAVGALAGGCGGSEQNAGEPRGSFPVQIVRASFPALQAVPRASRLVLTVRNPGPRTLPNVAVTIDSFSYTDLYKEEAAPKQPVWIVDQGPGTVPRRPVQSQAIDPPGSGQTAYVNTWALGPLRAGQLRTFVWRVTPVKSGVHRVNFLVSAGLAGNARAHLSIRAVRVGERAGNLGRGVVVVGVRGAPAGHFTVAIAGQPPTRHVNPETGAIAPGPYVPSAGV